MTGTIANTPTDGQDEGRLRLAASLAVALAVLGWAYWPALANLVQRWEHDRHYSHGFIVPGLALVVWWVRRRAYPVTEARPSWWGWPVLLAGAALRLIGAYYYLDWFDGLSLLPVLLGLERFTFGLRTVVWRSPRDSLGFVAYLCATPT